MGNSEILKDVVQPDAWYKDLPRKAYESLEKIEQSQEWFAVYELPHSVYAIYEPGHFQEVISFLIMGDKKAILFDTGMGIGDMKKLVDELWDKELVVLNSHTHFDHIGCNYQFDEIYVHPYSGAKERLLNGMTHDDNKENLVGDSTCVPYPDRFDPDDYSIKPSKPVALEDGQVFDLGSRQIEVIFTPGHSPDSVMLLDKENSILFTGDTFYPATLYCHLSSKEGIDSDFDTYKDTMIELADKIKVDKLYCSHNEPVVAGDTLQKVAKAFCDIENKKVEYQVDESGLFKYQFEGFAIVTKGY
jgi:glyoxylase-like metal-dependent hydrolase (beta-lactamase superfamily II)